MHVFNEHLGVINSLKFTQELEFLVSASGDNTMKVWDLEKDRREVTLNSHTAPLRDILICNQNEYIISCSDDKSFKIWSFPEFMEDRTFKVLNNEFNSQYTFPLDIEITYVIFLFEIIPQILLQISSIMEIIAIEGAFSK